MSTFVDFIILDVAYSLISYMKYMEVWISADEEGAAMQQCHYVSMEVLR